MELSPTETPAGIRARVAALRMHDIRPRGKLFHGTVPIAIAQAWFDSRMMLSASDFPIDIFGVEWRVGDRVSIDEEEGVLGPVDSPDRLRLELEDARNRLEAAQNQMRAIYRERNIAVALAARLVDRGAAWIGKHDPTDPRDSSSNDAAGYREFMSIVFVEIPTGQVSWTIHDDEVAMFASFLPEPELAPKWDGHTTAQKNQRVIDFVRSPDTRHERDCAYPHQEGTSCPKGLISGPACEVAKKR